MTVREVLDRVLREYDTARKEPMKGHAFMDFRNRAEESLATLDAVRGRPTLRVKVSFGVGNWGRVAWIAFLDERETKSTQTGVYPVYLFREDLSGVYLTFNQGVTEVRKEHGAGKRFREVFAERKAALRPLAAPLRERGFMLDDRIDLHASAGLGQQYQVSTVAYKLYEPGRLPKEDALLADLEAVLRVYEAYLDGKHQLAPFRGEVAEPAAVRKSSTFVEGMLEVTRAVNMYYPEPLLLALQAGLACQPFTLLAGPTGTGKTQLAEFLDQLEDFTVRIVEVEGGWLDSSSAFGFISPATQDFVPGPVLLKLLELLGEATEETTTPVLLLDEINVSPPHVYLAPLLSALERAMGHRKTVPMLVAQSGLSEVSKAALRGAVQQHPGLRLEEAGPFLRLVLDIPHRLRVVGTLNFDASTEDLAPKLLSRSFVVWFEAPTILADFHLQAKSAYSLDADRPLLEVLQELQVRGFPISARSVRRAQMALSTVGVEEKQLTDILLSGLVLPHVQTVMEGQQQRLLQEEFVDALPEGLFRTRLQQMRAQLHAEGMASLWLLSQ